MGRSNNKIWLYEQIYHIYISESCANILSSHCHSQDKNQRLESGLGELNSTNVLTGHC